MSQFIAVELYFFGVAIVLEELANPFLLFGHKAAVAMQVAVVGAVAMQITDDDRTHLRRMACLHLMKDMPESYG